jgi:hypothetical protein
MAQDLRPSSSSRKDQQDLDDLFYPIPLYGELLMALLFTLSIIQQNKLIDLPPRYIDAGHADAAPAIRGVQVGLTLTLFP